MKFEGYASWLAATRAAPKRLREGLRRDLRTAGNKVAVAIRSNIDAGRLSDPHRRRLDSGSRMGSWSSQGTRRSVRVWVRVRNKTNWLLLVGPPNTKWYHRLHELGGGSGGKGTARKGRHHRRYQKRPHIAPAVAQTKAAVFKLVGREIKALE